MSRASLFQDGSRGVQWTLQAERRTCVDRGAAVLETGIAELSLDPIRESLLAIDMNGESLDTIVKQQQLLEETKAKHEKQK